MRIHAGPSRSKVLSLQIVDPLLVKIMPKAIVSKSTLFFIFELPILGTNTNVPIRVTNTEYDLKVINIVYLLYQGTFNSSGGFSGKL